MESRVASSNGCCSDQMTLLAQIKCLSESLKTDDPKEMMSSLQAFTKTHQLLRITAERLSEVWILLIKMLKESSASVEIFSIGLWFLEQISKEPTKDLGLCQCFTEIYLQYPTELNSIAKEVFKKIFPMISDTEAGGFLDCLVNLCSSFTTFELETTKTYMIILSKHFMKSPTAAKLAQVIFEKGVVEKKLRRTLLSQIMNINELSFEHLNFIGSLITCGYKSSTFDLVLELRKCVVRTKDPRIIDAVKTVLSNFNEDYLVDLLAELVKPSKQKAGNYFKDYVIPDGDLENIFSAIFIELAKIPEFNASRILAIEISCIDPILFIRPLSKVPRLASVSLEEVSNLTTKYPSCIQQIAVLYQNAFIYAPDKLASLSQQFARCKTIHALEQDDLTANLLFLDACLETFFSEDPLMIPYNMIRMIHGWLLSINCSSLFPSTIQLCPDLFNEAILESLSVPEKIDVLYAIFKSCPERKNLFKTHIEDTTQEFSNLSEQSLEKITELLVHIEIQSMDLAFAAFSRANENNRPFLYLFDSSINSETDVLKILARFSLVPRAGRNDALYIDCLLFLVRNVIKRRLNCTDSVFILEAVQSLLIPFFSSPQYRTQVREIIKCLCKIGDNQFRTDIIASLIRQSLDDTRISAMRCTYISLLSVIPNSDPVTITGILLGLAKDNRSIMIQQTAVDSLAAFVFSRADEIFHLLPQISITMLRLADLKLNLGSLCVAFTEALGTELAGDGHEISILLELIHFEMRKRSTQSHHIEEILSCCTRIILIRRSFDSCERLIELIALALKNERSVNVAIECTRWVMEFLPEIGKLALDLVFSGLLQQRHVQPSIDLVLSFCIKGFEHEFVTKLIESSSTVLLKHLVGELTMLPSKSINDIISGCFQRAMDGLSVEGASECIELIELIHLVILSFQSFFDPEINSSILTSFQPHIIAILGLVCNHQNCLVKAHGYLFLAKLCSVNFYGLGISAHPRIDRLLSALAECLSGPEQLFDFWPERIEEYSKIVMVAAWSYVIESEKFGSKFALERVDDFIKLARESVLRTVLFDGEVADLTVNSSNLIPSYSVSVRCAKALMMFDPSNPTCFQLATAVSLRGISFDSLWILQKVPLEQSARNEILSYLYGYDKLSLELIHLAEKLDDHCLILNLLPAFDFVDEMEVSGLFKYLSKKPLLDTALHASFAKLVDRPLTTLLAGLKSTLPNIKCPERFTQLFRLFMCWIDIENKTPLIIQVLSFLVTFSELPLIPAPIIKTFTLTLKKHIDCSIAVDCAMLAVCKSSSKPLITAIAAEVLPHIELPSGKKQMAMEALKSVLSN